MIVEKFTDERIRYILNESNIGMRRNWNKAITESKGEYLCILGDDDWLHRDFLKESVPVLDNNPSVGLSFAHCNKVDGDRNILSKWGYEFAPSGLLKGVEYLYYTSKYEACLTNSTTVLMRRNVFETVGEFEEEFGANTFDFNMWIKIAEKFDMYFIDKVLSDYRIHPDQVSEIHWRVKENPTGKIGTYLELTKVLSILNTKENLEKAGLYDQEYINKKIVKLGKELTKYIQIVLPKL